MRRIRALSSTSLDISSVLQLRQQQVKEQAFLSSFKQTLPKFDQHTMIKARSIQLQSQKIFPIESSSHRIGSLSI
jgi:hypothetical protein